MRRRSERPHRGRGWPLAAAALTLLWSCEPSAPGAPEAVAGVPHPELEAVPEPSLDGVEPQISAQIEAARTALGTALEGAAPAAELAASFGRLGQLYHAYELRDAASACYRNARLLAPEDPRWRYYLAALLERDGRLEAASAALQELLALTPSDLPALLRLGRLHLELGRLEAAEETLRRALELDPGSAAAHHRLGQLAMERGELQEAVAHFETALELQPEATAIHYPLAQAYRRLGNTAAARTHLQAPGRVEVAYADPLMAELGDLFSGAAPHLRLGGQAEIDGRFEIALAEYRKAVEAEGENATAHQRLAAILARRGDLGEAEAHYRTALELSPLDPVTHYNLGLVLANRGKLAEAERRYRRAVELAPELIGARLSLASLLAARGDAEGARGQYDAVLEIEPSHRSARAGKAEALGLLRRPREALPLLRDLLAEEGEDTGLRLRLASLLLELGDLEAVIAESEIVQRQGVSRRQRGRAHFLAAVAQRRQGKRAAAVEHFQAALAADEELDDARLQLAGVLGEAGRFGDAAVEFRRLVEGHPGHTAARLGEATALFLDERFEEALARLEAGVAALPDDADLIHALARFLISCPRADLRDLPRGLALARRAYEVSATLLHAETVGAALAGGGRVRQAIAWQRQLLAEAEARGEAATAARLRRHLIELEARLQDGSD